MPTYEFRCRRCGETFVEQRPMSASSDPATCSQGHSDTTRLLNVAGSVSSIGSGSAPASGGCCGGGCCS